MDNVTAPPAVHPLTSPSGQRDRGMLIAAGPYLRPLPERSVVLIVTISNVMPPAREEAEADIVDWGRPLRPQVRTSDGIPIPM